MSQPIPVRVTRYRCPHCSRSHSSRSRATEHMGRCWYNPDAKGCKTCRHFDNTYEDGSEGCDLGVNLAGRPACGTCGGLGFDPAATWDSGEKCPACGGDGDEIKPGPVTGCASWQPLPTGDDLNGGGLK